MRVDLYYLLLFVLFNFSTPVNASSIKHPIDSISWELVKQKIRDFQHKHPDSTFYFLQLADSFAHQQAPDNLGQLFLQNAWGNYFVNKSSTDTSIYFFRNALKVSKTIGEQKIIYSQMIKLAGAYNDIYLSDSALKYYRMALEFYLKSNDSITTASVLSGIATALIESGQNKQALEKLYEAEQIFKTSSKFRELGVIYDNMALINARLGYEENTIKFGKKAIALYQKAHDTLMLADAYANLGVSYKNLNQYDTARYYYEKSNVLADKIKSTWLLAKNLHNIGVVYDVTGNPDKAAESFTASLKICRQENFRFGTFTNSINLGDYEMNYGDVQQAIRYFEKAAEIGIQDNYGDLGLVYNKLHLAHDKAGRREEALKYLRKYMHYSDSASSAQKHQEIMELQTKYETQKKEAQILKLQQENQREELLRAYMLLGLVLVLIIALLIIMRSRKKHAQQKQNTLKLEKENEQKQSLMQKLRLENQVQEQATEKYRLDLKLKEQELVYHTLKEAGIKHTVKKIRDKLLPFSTRFARKKDQEHYTAALQEIALETAQDPLADFEEMFLQMHDGFYEKLLSINPDFTRSELQMTALLRMNLPSKEMANMLNLALSTIDKRRHNIRKKLNLSSDQSLTGYLISL